MRSCLALMIGATPPLSLAQTPQTTVTQADHTGVTMRTLLGSRSLRWEDIDGLRFSRGSWARAQLKNGDQVRLPAVTFATLPQLTQASDGRVPNPYAN